LLRSNFLESFFYGLQPNNLLGRYRAMETDTTATMAKCPKCATTMILTAITPHSIATHMERHTFFCANCNQSQTYMLPAK
jgi:predicted RNA-binding Zn-ribbon protein involved in translation (DUF1610 family)